MKLISLNIWGGRVYEPLITFIKEKSSDIDIFCFQEVFNDATTVRSVHANSIMDIFARISVILPNHHGIFIEQQTNEEGQAMFVRKNINILENGGRFVVRFKDAMGNNDARTLGRAVQYCRIEHSGKEYFIGNFHGLWNGQGKTDTPDRISQSENIKTLLNEFNLPKVLVGDFNLLPDTESMKILEQGMINVNKKFGLAPTRSSHYTKPDKYADYVLVSPGVRVVDFKVLQDEVSDHLPLFLEFE